jgi:hypothetical protein
MCAAGSAGNDNFGGVQSMNESSSNAGFNTSNVKQVWGQQAASPAPPSHSPSTFSEPPAPPPSDFSSGNSPAADSWGSGAQSADNRWGASDNFEPDGKQGFLFCSQLYACAICSLIA